MVGDKIRIRLKAYDARVLDQSTGEIVETAKRFANALSLIRIAPSLGSVESLVSLPCLTSHAMLTPDERRRADIADSLIRLAVGIEDIEDLKADVDRGLLRSA